MAVISRIGQCRSCKRIGRRDYPDARPVSAGCGIYQRTVMQHGRMLPNRWIRASEDTQCPHCLAFNAWSSHRIEGFKVDTVPCDARCTEAKGHKCDCSCGGANHGKSYLACTEIVPNPVFQPLNLYSFSSLP